MVNSRLWANLSASLNSFPHSSTGGAKSNNLECPSHISDSLPMLFQKSEFSFLYQGKKKKWSQNIWIILSCWEICKLIGETKAENSEIPCVIKSKLHGTNKNCYNTLSKRVSGPEIGKMWEKMRGKEGRWRLTKDVQPWRKWRDVPVCANQVQT